jgi:hypothetical protein
MDREAVTDFLKKAHAMVDDPSTDSAISWSEEGKSFIVWHPAECYRNHLPRLLGITDFLGFHTYGFRRNESTSGIMEYACDDFVRGQPELVEKIAERYVEKEKANHEVKVKAVQERLKNCKNKEERDLVRKERRESIEKRRKHIIDEAFAAEIDNLMARISSEKERRKEMDSLSVQVL